MIDILADQAACRGAALDDVVSLVERATRSTFYGTTLTDDQLAANARIPALGGQMFFEAACSPNHQLLAAIAGDKIVGFSIATRHDPGNLELDWLMIDPDHHGSGLADRLMEGGTAWLGREAPIWLTVLRHNRRAIAFYRRHGFEIDEAARFDHAVPSWIMRRPAKG